MTVKGFLSDIKEDVLFFIFYCARAKFSASNRRKISSSGISGV